MTTRLYIECPHTSVTTLIRNGSNSPQKTQRGWMDKNRRPNDILPKKKPFQLTIYVGSK